MIATTRTNWDVIVIGAGPAGSIAARQCALGGASVLLVDKSVFPRSKVCGCCLSRVALNALDEAGLSDAITETNGLAFHTLKLCAASRITRLSIPQGLVLSRSTLDNMLIEQAMHAGVKFVSNVEAHPGVLEQDRRVVHLRHADHEETLRASVVVLATGLVGAAKTTGAESSALKRRITRHSPIGVGTILSFDHGYETGVIHMAVARGGYVGLVVLEDGRLNVAAAFDPRYTRSAGGITNLASVILQQAGYSVPHELAQATWTGTPRLTSRPGVTAIERLMLIGDAAGYVEPFTGEGMTWAILSGAAVAPIVLQHLEKSSPSPAQLAKRWIARHHTLLGKRQRTCHAITRLLRHPMLTRVSMNLINHHQGLANYLIRRVHQPAKLI